ncbi:hypothetical protein Tco_0526328 [Tanacetum coccineum]
MAGALPSDTVKNPKLNVNSTSLVLSACSYQTEDPQCSTYIHGLINTITIHPKQQSDSNDDKQEEIEEVEKDNPGHFDTFPTIKELRYHEWLLKNPRPPWVKTKIRTRNLNNVNQGLKVFIRNLTYVCDFMVLEDTTSIIDHDLGSVIFRKPFMEATGLVYDIKEGTILFEKDKERIVFKHIDFTNIKTDHIPPFVIRSDDDNSEKTHYSDNLDLGPEYKYDENVCRAIRSLIAMKGRRNEGEVTIKRHRRDLSSDGVRKLTTASGRNRLESDLKDSIGDGVATITGRRPINWLERLPARSITTWEDLTTRFLVQFFPPGRTLKLFPHRGIDPLLQVQIFYDHVNPVTRRTIDQSASDVPSTSDRRLIELENQVQCLMEAHIAPMQPTQVNKITSLCELCSGPYDTQYYMENPKLAFVEYASSCIDEARGLVSNFMASQDIRLSKLEDDFKQQQSKMTNKIDTVLKAITDRMAGALPSNTLVLDTYHGELRARKNGSAFVQGEVSAKMEDPGLFTLPCRLGDSKPFDTLVDLGSCVNIIRRGVRGRN